MWAGIIVIGVVIALFLLARLVLSGSLGRLDRETAHLRSSATAMAGVRPKASRCLTHIARRIGGAGPPRARARLVRADDHRREPRLSCSPHRR